VIANCEIPLQEELIKKSGGGLLVDWTPKSIKNGIIYLANNHEHVMLMQKNAIDYARIYLRYDAYLPKLEELM
jgi:hypothetical protein